MAQAAPSERAPPRLPIDIVEDILLRFPPDQPAHLVRAAFVCKQWSLHVAGDSFRRLYRQRYREAPVLGLVGNLVDTGGAARFVPTRLAFRPARADRPGYRAHDARHGRVLLSRMRAPRGKEAKEDSILAVWDPIADEQWSLPLLTRPRKVRTWNAAVLCAAAAGCDHLDCHRAPFRVVFVGIDAREMFAHVYSSESAAWSAAATAGLPGGEQLDVASPGVLVRDALYFLLQGEKRILKCDPATREMSLIHLPGLSPNALRLRIVLMTMEDGGLGFAQVDMNCILRLWSLRIGPEQRGDGDGGPGLWVISRGIDLKRRLVPAPRQLPAPALGFGFSPPCLVVAFVDSAGGVIFLKTNDGLYSFDVRSSQSVKVDMSSGFYGIIPFKSFYTPGR